MVGHEHPGKGLQLVGRGVTSTVYFSDAWAPPGKVWEHRYWYIRPGAESSGQPETYYWTNLEDAFEGGDPQFVEDIVFHRTPQRGWRWSYEDEMGGQYRHEARLIPKRRGRR